MATGALLWDLATDVGTASAGSVASVTGTPASAVLDQQLAARWRSAPGISTWLLVDIGAQRQIDTVAILATNLSDAATWRIRISTTDATGAAGDAHDSGTITAGADPLFGGAAIYLLQASPVTGRYVRLDLADATLPYLEVGRLVAGRRWRFARNFRLGWTVEAVDDAQIATTWGGAEWRDARSVRRRVRVELPAITRAEYEVEAQALLRAGAGRDVLLILDQDSAWLPRDSVFGRLAPVRISNPWPHYYSCVIDVIERVG